MSFGKYVTGIRVTPDASATDDLLQLQSATGTTLVRVDVNGVLTAPNVVVSNGASSNVPLLAAANTFTKAPQTLNIDSTTAAGIVIKQPASYSGRSYEVRNDTNTLMNWAAATGEFYLTGGLHFMSSGTSQSNITRSNSNGSLTFNLQNFSGASLIVLNSNTGTVPFVVKGAASQTADLQQWQNSAGTNQAFMSSGGALRLAGRLSAGNTGIDYGLISGLIGSAGTIGLVIRAAASQTANLQEWQDSSANILARVDSAGRITTSTTFSESITGRNINVANSAGGSVGITLNPNSTTSDGTVFGAIALNGATADLGSSPSAQIKMWRSSGAAAGTMLFQVRGTDGVLYDRFSIANGVGALFVPQSAGSGALIVRGAASQTADLQQWQNSSGTVLAGISSGGFGFFGLAAAGTGVVSLQTTSASTVGLVVRASASQTANLQEWQNSSGTLLSRINSDGVPFFPTLRTTNSYIQAGENSSGGYVRFDKQTAANFNPGSGKAALYFRDGTNAGTLKLVVIAGASGAETTILDNIPQT